MCCPEEVEKLHNDFLALTNRQNLLVEKIDEYTSKLPETKELKATERELREVLEKLRTAIDVHGSFQDVEKGWYALKQRKVSVVYLPEKVRRILPRLAEAVIEETVSKKAVEGLIKAKMIMPDQAEAISEKKETFAYIIK